MIAGAEVSKAFSCLADPQKRAAYDRYGEDDGMQRRGSGMPHGFATPDDFDPNEIFNMFFGGGGFGGGFGRCVWRGVWRYEVLSCQAALFLD